MDLGTKAVVTGKEAFYLGKTSGTVYYERIEVKGDPVKYVKACLKKTPKMELYQRLGKLANDEESRHPWQPGKKMGNKSFWRNAYRYLTNRIVEEKKDV